MIIDIFFLFPSSLISQMIYFSVLFSHTSLGTHQLPVLLKIEQGREIKVFNYFLLFFRIVF